MRISTRAPRDIAIVGAGQAALSLAVQLQASGHHQVTLVTDRSAEEVRSGRMLTSQVLFGPALDGEDPDLMPTWEEESPAIEQLTVTLKSPGGGEPEAVVRGPLEFPARSVDLRLKLSTWLGVLEEYGATVLTRSIDIDSLEELAAANDLVVVASGQGVLGEIFERDEGRSRDPRGTLRELAMILVRPTGREIVSGLDVHTLPGVGELFRYPMLTADGVAEVLLVEAAVNPYGAQAHPLGDALTAWREGDGVGLDDLIAEISRHMPGVAGELEACEPFDADEVQLGRVRPEVKNPVGVLPSGATVLGLGTAVIRTDPLFSAPSNNASQAADYYRTAIQRRGEAEFDDEWKRRTFESFWRGWAKWTVQWVDGLLDGLTPVQLSLLCAGADLPGVTAAIAEMIEDPRTAHQWWYEVEEAEALVERARQDRRAGIDARDLRAAFGRFTTGVTVVTTRGADGTDYGVTANSFTSVSIDPPLVLWCPQLTSTSLPAFEEGEHFCVNVLTAEQLPVSRQMSVSGSTEKFKGVPVERGIGGVPVLTGSAATFECRVVARYDAGDHRIHVGEVENYTWNSEPPLGFLGGRYTGV